ncbi:MAG: DUF4160 domain-containing protein [Selenomonadaceae bacterium]|nr:DUF4160 domain-containing protein [Selenomonadaceae bacterium]MBR3723344.1 DUF4160 domain-containing protein [Selenomonadaceae bacterium]
MPNLGQILEYSLYFTAREGNPLEPVHVHIGFKPAADNTKFWLLSNGKVKLAHQSRKMNDKEARQIAELLELRHKDICQSWKEFFGEINYFE